MKLIRFDSLWMRLNNHTDFKWFRFGKSNSKFSFVVSIICSCCCCCLVYNIFAQFNKSKLIKPDVASVSQQYASFSVKMKKKIDYYAAILCFLLWNENDCKFLLQLLPKAWTKQPRVPSQQACLWPLAEHVSAETAEIRFCGPREPCRCPCL